MVKFVWIFMNFKMVSHKFSIYEQTHCLLITHQKSVCFSLAVDRAQLWSLPSWNRTCQNHPVFAAKANSVWHFYSQSSDCSNLCQPQLSVLASGSRVQIPVRPDLYEYLWHPERYLAKGLQCFWRSPTILAGVVYNAIICTF